MPQHYQLLKPRLNLGPSTAALLKIFVKEFVRVFNGIQTSTCSFFFLKNGEKLKKKKKKKT